MNDAKETIQGWVDRLRGLRAHVEAEAPAVVADMMRGDLAASVGAGSAVDGYKWAPRVEDGGRAFANGMSHVRVSVSGRTVLIVLEGPMAYAQWGTGKMAARPLMPVGGIRVSKLGDAIRQGLVEMAHGWMARKGSHR